LRDPFLYKTPSGRTVGDIVFYPVDKTGVNFTVVDVGARNGMFLIPPTYAKRSEIIGFEPHPAEYEKLISNSTDAMRAGINMPLFKSVQYYNCALWDKEEVRPFFVTTGPATCTLMGSTDNKVAKNMWLDKNNKPHKELHAKVINTIPMQCRRLDAILDSKQKVDFLKVDTEGADMCVLKGADKLLKAHNILFIKTEFMVTPHFQENHLLGHEHVFLHEHGYRLLDLDLDHPRYSRGKHIITKHADRRMICAGDAFFALDPDRLDLTPLDLHRLSIISLCLGFKSFALSLMRDAKLICSDEIEQIEITLSRKWTIRRVRNVWNQIPYEVFNILRKIKKF